ncbi:hypothetical protein G9A89_009880 [Geosiphon pyriformis]|nr:hypothetical protein G9A89_009880 [Geosiphon pyriformis]
MDAFQEGKKHKPPSKYAAHLYLKNPNSTLNYLDLNSWKNGLQQRSSLSPPKKPFNPDTTLNLPALAVAANQAYCGRKWKIFAVNIVLGEEYIIAFGGFKWTKSEWIAWKPLMTTFQVNDLKPEPAIRVAELWQKGFLMLKDTIFSTLEAFIKKGLTIPKIIHFTGWGTGGALATIAAITWQLESYINNKFLDFQVRATTFGAPRVGNKYFACLINKFLDIRRVTYFKDHVPHFPKPKLEKETMVHHELEIWIVPKKLCDCPTEFNIWECQGFDYNGKAPRQVGVSNETFFPHHGMTGENQECNAGQSIVQVRRNFVHAGPYFGVTMGDCSSLPLIKLY